MSTRHNKKRKGRNNLNNRERTVTTLTEDPNTSFLVPTPSEEPAAGLMSSPFSVASSSAPANNSAAFQIPGNYSFSYTNPYMQSVHGQNQQPTPYYQQQQSQQLPPGENDLEVLENLKTMIKNGQHEFYRAVPQPTALANIYLGPSTIHFPTDQGPSAPGYSQPAHDPTTQANPAGNIASSADSGRLPPHPQSKDWDISSKKHGGPLTAVSGPPASNNVLSNLNNPSISPTDLPSSSQSDRNMPSETARHNGSHRLNNLPPSSKDTNDSRSSVDLKTPVSAGTIGPNDSAPQNTSKFDSPTNSARPFDNPASQKSDLQRSAGDRAVGESPYGSRPNNNPPVKYEDKDDSRAHRDSGWPQRDAAGPPDDRRGRDFEPPRTSDARSLANDSNNRGPSGRDQRFYDRDRLRDKERDRDRDWDRDRDRDRRPDFRYRDDRPRITDTRRPPLDQRHYEPRYNSDFPRRFDSKSEDTPMDIDRRADPLPPVSARPGPSDDRAARPLPVDDRPPPGDRAARPPVEDRPRIPANNDRPPPARDPLPDNRSRAPIPEDRHARPLVTDRRAPADERSARPAPPLDDITLRPSADDRSVRPISSSTEDRNVRPPVPLEERIGRSVPSLQDRLSQPPAARTDAHPTRLPNLEERLSHPAVGPSDHSRPSQPDDRLARPPPVTRPVPPDDRARAPDTSRPSLPDDRPRPDERGRPVERYNRPVTPPDRNSAVPPRSAGFGAPTRAPSVGRDDVRPIKTEPSPHRSDLRDHRPGQEPSRERPNLRPLDYSGAYDRRSDVVDVNVPPRFGDSRIPYTRRFSPPSEADLARDRARVLFPPSPPRVDPPVDVEGDRRYPPAERRDWPYDGRRREWGPGEEDSYWKSRHPWERNSLDRDRFDRGVPPIDPPPRSANGWETREERERRVVYPESPPARSFDEAQRPLSSRLTDGYPTYSYRDMRYPPPYPSSGNSGGTPPFSRVRPRSPSPIGRRPGVGAADDLRPPVKRQREDPPYSNGYYSPTREHPRRGSISGDYPRVATPPPSSGGNYYDARDRPPPFSSASGSGGGAGGGGALAQPLPHDREYPRDRPGDAGGYGSGPSSYDRSLPPPRSPPPPLGRLPPAGYGRGGYARGGDGREERRYGNMPPPARAP